MNTLKTYLGHLVAYIVSAAGIVAGLDPSLLPPQYAVGIAVAGAITTVAHHSYSAGGTAALVKAAATAVSQAAGTAPAKLAIVAILMAPLLMLHGCASAPANIQKGAAVVVAQDSQPIVQALTLAAVATAEQQGVPAAAINGVAKKVLEADTGSTASLATVGALVNQELAKLNLPPADLAAAQILEIALGGAINAKLGQDPTIASVQAAVADIAKYVVAATGG
jgi:hypothetical protein